MCKRKSPCLHVWRAEANVCFPISLFQRKFHSVFNLTWSFNTLDRLAGQRGPLPFYLTAVLYPILNECYCAWFLWCAVNPNSVLHVTLQTFYQQSHLCSPWLWNSYSLRSLTSPFIVVSLRQTVNYSSSKWDADTNKLVCHIESLVIEYSAHWLV